MLPIHVCFQLEYSLSISSVVSFILLFSTPFTKVRRHTYIDPDYALDDNETFVKMKHRDYYQHYLEDKRKKRLKRNIDK